MTVPAVAGRRVRYDDACAMAHAYGVVGNRWALLVVRELMFRGKRFSALRAGLPGITASVLTRRLEDLIAEDVVEYDPELGVYSLTAAGRDLRPVLDALGRWGVGRPNHDPTRFLSPSSLMLSLPVMVRPDGAFPAGCRVGFDLGRESFVVTFDGAGRPVVEAVRHAQGDVVFTGDPSALAAMLYSDLPPGDLTAGGRIEVTGDRAVAWAFADRFRKLDFAP